MAHKLFITSLVAFMPWELQMSIAMAACFLYMAVILVGRPYLRKGDDRLHLFAQTELILLLMAGNVANTKQEVDSLMDTVMSVVLIAAVILFFLYFLVGAMSVGWKLFTDSERGKKIKFIKKKADKAAKKEKSIRGEFLTEISVDRRNLRRSGKKSLKEEGMTMQRNALFMADGVAAVSYDAVDKADLTVIVNPLVVDHMRAKMEEEKSRDAEALREAERKRKAREQELERLQKMDEVQMAEYERKQAEEKAQAEAILLAAQQADDDEKRRQAGMAMGPTRIEDDIELTHIKPTVAPLSSIEEPAATVQFHMSTPSNAQAQSQATVDQSASSEQMQAQPSSDNSAASSSSNSQQPIAPARGSAIQYHFQQRGVSKKTTRDIAE
jgi:hypothetical protein